MPASKAKMKPRPARLVASKRMAAASKPIAAINSTDSPLLRLAPELRNRIYELVLGGKTLHFHGRREAVKLCSHSLDSASFADYSTDHKKCAFGATYCTSLLRVCHQINEESALIPFTSNTFALHMSVDLWSFIDSLLPQQRKAIKSLQLRADWRPFAVDGSQVKQLTGLRNLEVKLFSLPSSFEQIAAELEKLGNGQLKSGNVGILPIFSDEGPPHALFATWAAQMEQKLLDRTSYSQRNKKAMVELEKARAISRGARKARKAEQDREKEEAMKASTATRERRGLRALH